MATPLPVVPGLWQIELGLVNAYVLADGDDLVVIDTGLPGSEGEILGALAALGHAPADVTAIVVTHHHADHAGSLAALLEATGAPAWMHPADAAETRVGNAARPYRTTSGVLHWVLKRAIVRPSAAPYAPAPVAHEVVDGDRLPGGLEAIWAPGHTAGHLAFLWPPHGGVLLVGDACTNLPVLTLSVVYEDLAEGRATLQALAALDVDTAVFGHGKPIVGGAGEKMRQAFG